MEYFNGLMVTEGLEIDPITGSNPSCSIELAQVP